jgi:hypothetical protein
MCHGSLQAPILIFHGFLEAKGGAKTTLNTRSGTTDQPKYRLVPHNVRQALPGRKLINGLVNWGNPIFSQTVMAFSTSAVTATSMLGIVNSPSATLDF